MEVDFYSGNRIEGSGPYQPPYYAFKKKICKRNNTIAPEQSSSSTDP